MKRGCEGGAQRLTARGARASAFALHDDGDVIGLRRWIWRVNFALSKLIS